MSAAHARQPRVALVGASGLVGQQIMELLAERAFSAAELGLFAGERGTHGPAQDAGDRGRITQLKEPSELGRFDLAFIAATPAASAEIVAARPGPVLIDLSACARAPSAAMAAPGITPRQRVAELAHQKLIELPNPAAHAISTILRCLELESGFTAITLMVGASAQGRAAVEAQAQQVTDLLNGRLEIEPGQTQLAFNLFRSPADEEAEMVIASQVGALTPAAPQLALQLMHAPVLHGCGLTLSTSAPGDADDWARRLRAAPGVMLAEGGANEPLGVVDIVGSQALFVKLEPRRASPQLWGLFDNLQIAALDALWAAETLLGCEDFEP